MATKEKEKLTDDPCSADAHEFVCNTHNQPLVDCANQRLRYVKMAREMDARSMASARTWQKVANDRISQRNAYRLALQGVQRDVKMVCPQLETCARQVCQASYRAWAIADNALKLPEPE